MKNSKKLSVKDLITTGVFAALLLVAASLGGTVFAITPTLTFYFPIGAAVFAGPIYLLLLAKVPKRGAMMIAGAIFCILGLMTGMHWGMDFGVLIMAIIADFVAGTKKYKSVKVNVLSYILYAFGPMGTYFVFYIDPEGWAQTMLKNGTTQDYIDSMSTVASRTTLFIMIIGTVVVAAISRFIGRKLLHKQFEKAGITA